MNILLDALKFSRVLLESCCLELEFFYCTQVHLVLPVSTEILAERVRMGPLEPQALRDPLVLPEIQGRLEAMVFRELQVVRVAPEVLDNQVR